MAILSTVRGHVESDPMRIPTPARSSTGTSFESVLEQVAAPESEPEATPAPREVERPQREEPVAEQREEPEPEPGTDEAPAVADEVVAAANAAAVHTAAPEVTETLRRGEPEPQESAGKGADSPRTSSPALAVDNLLAAAMQRGAKQPGTPLLAGASGIAPITAAKGVDAPTRAIAMLAERGAAPTKAAAVAAGYRANGKVSAELVDQARDSVFKQILLKLTDGGGEMRVRLQPPELGQLDLHLLVEQGNRLNLWIGAERPELAAMLQQNLPQLQQALQDAGLDVAGAQVGMRDGSGDGRAGADGGFAGGDDRDQTNDDEGLPRWRGGFVSAEGLDFWA